MAAKELNVALLLGILSSVIVSLESVKLFRGVGLPYETFGGKALDEYKEGSRIEGGNENEDDGGIQARISAFELMYGKNYTKDVGYGQHYIIQVETKMQATAVGGSWTSLGPTYTPYPYLDSGRVRSILPNPTNPDIVYVLTSGGGLWKTTNFLTSTNPTWVPLTDFLTTTSGGSAALGSNPDTIYFGMGDPYDRVGVGGYFTKSIDGGSSWTSPIDLSTFDSYSARVTVVYFIAVDTSTGSDIILVSTNIGIFRSTDGGVTFTNPYNAAGKTYYPAIYSLVKTGSGGSLWWIGYDTYNKLLIISTNQGLSWGSLAGTNWGTAVGTDAARTTFAVGATGESTIYAQVAKRSDNHQLDIFKSTDGGITWTSLQCNANYAPTNPTTNLLTNLDVTGGQGWYNQMLLVDPSDSTRNTVYAGGNVVSVKTTNGGTSWTIISTWYNPSSFNLPYVHADFHAAAAYTTSSTGVTTLIFGTDGGLFASTNSGSTWTSEKNRGLVTQLPNFICGSPLLNRLMIGLQDQGTRERTDSTSTTWSIIYGGDGDGCAYSQAVNKVNMMSLYYSQFKCRYYANGAFGSTSACSTGITDAVADTPFYTNLRTPTATADPTGTIFFTLTHKKVYRSSMPSGSIVWTNIGTVGVNGISVNDIRETFQPMGIGPTSTNQVAFAKDSEICITTNGGTSWTTVAITSSVSGWSKGTSPVWASSTVLYLASENPTIGATRFIKSTNAGSTWTAPNTGSKLPGVPIGSLLVSSADASGNTVIAGTWIGAYITTDGGVNWNVLGSGLPNVIVSDMYQISNILYIAAYGRGVWQLTLPGQATNTPTSLPSLAPSPSLWNVPTSSPSIVPTTPSNVPTLTPSTPSNVPTLSPTSTPSKIPTSAPSKIPTSAPSKIPTSAPSSVPTSTPSNVPTSEPLKIPTSTPSSVPTSTPSSVPTSTPANVPTSTPSNVPTSTPSIVPTSEPSNVPTSEPSNVPTSEPSTSPTGCNVAVLSKLGDHFCDSTGGYNTAACNYDGGDCCEQTCGGYSSCGTTSYPFVCLDPAYSVLYFPTASPTLNPTFLPSSTPSTTTPTAFPTTSTFTPTTHQPSKTPTTNPSKATSFRPSTKPTFRPSGRPTSAPRNPTSTPRKPTRKPTKK